MKISLIAGRVHLFFTPLFLLVCFLIPSMVTAQTDAPDIAAWLTQHSLVSEAIRWQDANGIKAYSGWSATQKTDLLEMYQKIWNGEPLGLTDPPPNMVDLADDDYFLTVLSKDHAWPLFLAHVAHSLAVETGEWVPWSLTEYSQEELLELLDGSKMFQWNSNPGGYKVIYHGMPASPDFSFQFLSDNNMIGQDRLRTIGNLVNWCRYNMKHFIGWFTAKNAEDHWQYRGVTPISRVISGTPFYSDFWNAELFYHHTGGCWGTTTFLREVLRVVNIPVKRADTVPAHGGHSLPYFMSEGKYLSHGDDPYVSGIREFPVPIEELFIDQATYDKWFGPNAPPPSSEGLSRTGGVGRRPYELTIKYMHPPFYWINTDAGTLHQMVGTRPEPFIPSVQNAIGLAKTSDKIYWTERTSNTSGNIRRANFDGTNVEHVKSVTGVPHGIAVDNSNRKIYITNALGKIQRLNVDGSDFESKFITGLKSPKHIFVDAGNVYWTENNSKIRRASLRGTGINTLHTSADRLHDLLVYRDRIYWTKQTGVNSGKIQRADLSGANVRNIVKLNDIPISIDFSISSSFNLAAYREFLLWTTASGKIQKSYLYGQNVKDKNIVTVATDLTAPGRFVLGVHIPRPVVPKYQRSALYWIDKNNGTLHWFTGTLAERFLPNVRNATSLAVDITRGKVFWTEKTSHRAGKVRRSNLDGTHVEDVISLTGIPNDLAIDAARGKIYLTNSQGVIQRINTDGSNFKPNLIRNLNAPKHIALDSTARKLYWSDGGRIRRANLDGSGVKTFTKYSGNIGDIVVVGDKLYWTENTSGYEGYIKRAFLNSEKVERFGFFSRPLVGIAVDTEENRIYWSNSDGRIQRGYIPGRSGEMKERYIALPRQTVIAGLDSPGSIALGGDISNLPVLEYQHPAIYWSDNINMTLHRFTGEGVENLLPNVQNATSVTMDVENNKLYWTERTGDHSGRIQRANLDGSNVEQVRSLKSVPLHITLDTVNEKLYLINSWRKIQRLNYDGSNYENNLITRLNSPKGMIVDGLGEKLYWIEKTRNTTGSLKKANLDGTNVEQVVSVEGIPTSIAIDVMNHKLYLTNSLGKVQRLDFDGHNFEADLITGLDSPEGIAIDSARKKIYWAEMGKINSADLNGENLETVVTGLGTPINLNLGTPRTNISLAAAPTKLIVPTDVTHLYPNYPNPFNPETWIPYQLSKREDVTLRIYSVTGALVRTLSLGHQSAGIYQSRSRAAYWDGRNDVGEPVASGIYFYTLTAGEFTATRKLLILK